jgi:hypothetical protein
MTNSDKLLYHIKMYLRFGYIKDKEEVYTILEKCDKMDLIYIIKKLMDIVGLEK